MDEFSELRRQIDDINFQLLELLSKRGSLVQRIRGIKTEHGLPFYDPRREEEMLRHLVEANRGPYADDTIRALFKEVFKASLHLLEDTERAHLQVHRSSEERKTVIDIAGVRIGDKDPVIIAGPCAIESRDQLNTIAQEVNQMGVRILRGGAFKPRTSPYSFQGLGKTGLEYMREITQARGMCSVMEVLDTADVDLLCSYADIVQIGARNMHNYALLKAVGGIDKPVLLKRGFMATIEELLYSAEYILSEGNTKIILCERGIRTFERWTRNTLDISAVALLKQATHLPVIVDISHSAGRKDIAIPLAKAALAAGADGIMVEVHNRPAIALSDADQQLSIQEFRQLLEAIRLLQANG
jgi:3-deoxy-7-phosphoheptulonate synthase/chorismate mutase